MKNYFANFILKMLFVVTITGGLVVTVMLTIFDAFLNTDYAGKAMSVLEISTAGAAKALQEKLQKKT